MAWSMRPGRDARAGSILLRTVRGQDEEQVRVFGQSVHFVEDPVEQDLLAGAAHLLAIARDEIDILDDEHGRLQQACEREVLRQQSDLLGR